MVFLITYRTPGIFRAGLPGRNEKRRALTLNQNLRPSLINHSYYDANATGPSPVSSELLFTSCNLRKNQEYDIIISVLVARVW
jgi:hypothetical protein